jgi:hypothetical protein
MAACSKALSSKRLGRPTVTRSLDRTQERAIALLDAGRDQSGANLTAAIEAARRALIIASDEAGVTCDPLIAALDAALAISRSKA